MASIEQDLQRLKDRAEILEVVAAYARHADENDGDGMAALFVDDCVVALVKGGDPVLGPKNLADLFNFHLADVITGAHYIVNAELSFDDADPDTVLGHFYMYSVQRWKDYPRAADTHRYGRYHMKFVRDGGRWKISRLRLISILEYAAPRIAEHFGMTWPNDLSDLTA